MDTQEMRAALSRLEADFGARVEGMVGSVDRLAKATNALSSKMGDGFNRLGKDMSKAIDAGFDKVIAASKEADKAVGSFSTHASADIGKITVEIRAAADALKAYADRSQALERQAASTVFKSNTARENVESFRRQQQFRLAAQGMIEEEKRITESLRFEQRRQIDNLRQADSIGRIREQASQQRRLALWQTFYRTVGQFTENFSRQVGDGLGSGLRRLFTRERSELGAREGLWRGHQSALAGIEEQGQRNRLNIIGRFFDRRQAAVEAHMAKESKLYSSVGASAVSSRLNQGILGGALNATPLGYLGAGAGITAVVGGIGSALRVTSDYTSALAELAAVAKTSDDVLRQIDDTSVKLGNDAKLPGVSAKDAADAFRLLTVNGISLQDSLDGAAKSSLQLSRAVGESAEDAAKAVAAGINTFRLTGTEALSAADVIAKATSQSGSTLTEFNDAFKQAGSTIYSLFEAAEPGKQIFEEMSGILSLFAKNGLRGESAGTALKVMFTRLIAPAKGTKDLFNQIVASAGEAGSIMFDASGKTRTLHEAFGILRKGLLAMPTEAARAEAWLKLFGQRAGPQGVTKILGATNEEFEAMFKNMDAVGFAAERAAAKNSGYKGGLDALSSTMETIAIKFGRVIQPLFRGVAIGLSELMSNLIDGDGVWKKVRYGLLGVAAGLGAIVAVKGLSETLGLVRTAVMALSASPLGVLGVALAAAAAGIGVLVAKNPELLTSIKRTIGGLVDMIDPARLFSEAIKTVGGVVGGLATVVIPKAVKAVKDFVVGLSTASASGPASFFVNLGRTAANAFGAVVETVLALRNALFAGFEGATSMKGFLGFVQNLGNVMSGITVAARSFAASLGAIFSSDASIGEKVKESLGAVIPSIRKGLLSLPEEIGNPILRAVTKVQKFVTSAIVEPVEGAVEKIKRIWRDSFGPDSVGEEHGLIAGLVNLLNTVTRMLGRTLTAMLTDPTLLKTIGVVMASAATVAFAAIEGFISGVIEKLVDRVQSIFREIPIFGDLLAGIAGLGKQLTDILATALIAAFAWSKLKGPVGSFTSQLSKSFAGLQVLRLGGTLTASERDAYVKATTAATAEVRRRLTAQRDLTDPHKTGSRGPSQISAEVLKRKENVDAIEKERRALLERQYGVEKAARLIESMAAVEKRAAKVRGDAIADAARKSNVAHYGMAGHLLNLRLSLRESGEEVRRFYGSFADGSLVTKAKRALATVTGTVGLGTRSNAALERLRSGAPKADRLIDRLQDPGAKVREAAAARLRQRELWDEQERIHRQLAAAKVPEVLGLPGATAAVDHLRKRMADVGAELLSLDTKGKGVTGRLGVGFSKVVIAVADTAGALGARGLGEAVENLGRKFAGLEALPRTTESLFSKLRGSFDKLKEHAKASVEGIKQKFADTFGEGKEGVQNAVQTAVAAAEASMVGFFSGQALASSDGLVSKLTGVVGAIGAIGAGFAAGGPVGAGLAAISTAVGLVVGALGEADEKQKAWNSRVDDLRVKYIAARDALGGIEGEGLEQTASFLSDNVKEIERLSKTIGGGFQASLSDALTDVASGGDLDKAVSGLRKKINKRFADEPIRIGSDDFVSELLDDEKLADELQKILGRRDPLGLNVALEDFVGSRGQAEKLLKVYQTEFRKLIDEGKIDAQHLFDTFEIRRVGDEFKVVRTQLKGLNDEQVKDLNLIGEQLVSQATAISESASRTADLARETKKAADAQKESTDAVKSTADAFSAVASKADFAAKRAEILRDKFVEAASAAAGIDPSQNSKDPLVDSLTGGAGTDRASANLKALYDAAAPVRDAIRSLADALVVTDETGNKVTANLQDVLAGKAGDTALRDRVTAAQKPVDVAFQEWTAGFASNPQIAANWSTTGQQYMTDLKNAMLATANEAGGAGFGQQLLDTLQVFDEVTVQTKLVEANAEAIAATAGADIKNYRAVWDKNRVVIKFDAQPSDETIRALRALGLTVVGPNGRPLTAEGVQVPTRDPDRGARSTAGTATAAVAQGAANWWKTAGGMAGKATTSFDGIVEQIRASVASLPPFSGWTAAEAKIGLPYFYQQQIDLLRANPSSRARIDLTNKMFEVGHRFPFFARGDIVNRPTLGVFGEAGPEVIVPLSKPRRMVELLSKALAMTGGLSRFGNGPTGPHLPRLADGVIFGAASNVVSGTIPLPPPAPGRSMSSDTGLMLELIDAVRGIESGHTESNQFYLGDSGSPHANAAAIIDSRKAARWRKTGAVR